MSTPSRKTKEQRIKEIADTFWERSKNKPGKVKHFEDLMEELVDAIDSSSSVTSTNAESRSDTLRGGALELNRATSKFAAGVTTEEVAEFEEDTGKLRDIMREVREYDKGVKKLQSRRNDITDKTKEIRKKAAAIEKKLINQTDYPSGSKKRVLLETEKGKLEAEATKLIQDFESETNAELGKHTEFFQGISGRVSSPDIQAVLEEISKKGLEEIPKVQTTLGQAISAIEGQPSAPAQPLDPLLREMGIPTPPSRIEGASLLVVAAGKQAARLKEAISKENSAQAIKGTAPQPNTTAPQTTASPPLSLSERLQVVEGKLTELKNSLEEYRLGFVNYFVQAFMSIFSNTAAFKMARHESAVRSQKQIEGILKKVDDAYVGVLDTQQMLSQGFVSSRSKQISGIEKEAEEIQARHDTGFKEIERLEAKKQQGTGAPEPDATGSAAPPSAPHG